MGKCVSKQDPHIIGNFATSTSYIAISDITDDYSLNDVSLLIFSFGLILMSSS